MAGADGEGVVGLCNGVVREMHIGIDGGIHGGGGCGEQPAERFAERCVILTKNGRWSHGSSLPDGFYSLYHILAGFVNGIWGKSGIVMKLFFVVNIFAKYLDR
jgi:hypothetical protein